jgi:hypothetical protein
VREGPAGRGGRGCAKIASKALMRKIVEIPVVLLLAAGAAWAQQTGPIRPTAPPAIKRIPLHPEVPPPKLPTKEIIERFTANEAKYQAEFKKFGYVQTILVEELGGREGGPTGSYGVKVEVFVNPKGVRYERLLGKSTSTLNYLQLSSQDLEVLADMPLFPLAGDATAHYDFIYRGTQKVDELTTYVFRVEPKNIVTGHPSFSGVIWVDNEDLAIVKSYGQFVTGLPRAAGALPFSFFETYRENVEGKYWLPAYIRSDDTVAEGKSELPVRLIIKSMDFHLGKPVLPKAGSSK